LPWRGEVAGTNRIDLSAPDQEEVRARARTRLPHLEEQVGPSPSGYGKPRDVRLQVEAVVVAAVWRYEVGGARSAAERVLYELLSHHLPRGVLREAESLPDFDAGLQRLALGRRRSSAPARRRASSRRRACFVGRAPRSAPSGRASRRSSPCCSRAVRDSGVSAYIVAAALAGPRRSATSVTATVWRTVPIVTSTVSPAPTTFDGLTRSPLTCTRPPRMASVDPHLVHHRHDRSR
jgi:hypothetical protein